MTKPSREKQYTYTLRNKFILMHAENIQDFKDRYDQLSQMISEWMEDGIQLMDNGGVGDDYSTFYTTSSEIAKKHGFEYDPYENLCNECESPHEECECFESDSEVSEVSESGQVPNVGKSRVCTIN
jgi:hypothetical protein